MDNPKIIAFYLPQFHEIPENNEWWGKGFTEWTNTKRAKPLFIGHYQPKEPLNDNYYSLLDVETCKWQAKTAKENGVYGFCYYHYWFNGKKLLEKPLEILLKHPEIDMPFCISWANETWSRTWSGKEREILIRQQYGGEEDWENHLQYLLPFFRDKRYIRKEERPVFILYKSGEIPDVSEMIKYWNRRLQQMNMPPLLIIETLSGAQKSKKCQETQACLEFEPMYTIRNHMFWYKYKREIIQRLKLWKVGIFIKLDYGRICKKIVQRDSGHYYGLFPSWDNTPRMGKRAMIITGSSPEKFEYYLREQYLKSIKESHEFLFINAWNEWAEGACLEPDKKYGMGYLEAIKKIVSGKNDYCALH